MRATRWAIVGLSVVLALAASLFSWLNPDVAYGAGNTGGSRAFDIVFPLAVLSVVVVGELIARRHPQHLVAWFLLAFACAFESSSVVSAYGLYATATAPGPLPTDPILPFLAEWLQGLGFFFLLGGLVVFPDGRVPSPRWRAAGWFIVAVAGLDQVIAVIALGIGIRPTLGIPPPQNVLIELAIAGTTVPALFVAVASLAARFRRAHSPERQQLKWVAYAAGTIGLVLSFILLTAAFWGLNPVLVALAKLSLLLYPTAIGIAILRHRLYDIDRLINRTIVYGALSAVLGATYWLLVIGLGSLLRPLAGGGEIAVAATTLAVLALVQPLRRWVQGAVDHRFYRDRFDASRTLDAFSARLRDEVDLDAVRADLVDAAVRTVQPAHASVWLR